MKKLLLLPGDAVCDLAGLIQDNDNRQILRMFVNTLVWSAIGVAVILITVR